MPKVKIDRKYLMDKMAPIVMAEIQKDITKIAKREIIKANKELLREFLANEISKEIAAGPTSSSKFLKKGNLFSFFGFENGSDPVGELAEFLSKSIKLEAIRVTPKMFKIKVSISTPTLEDIESFTSLPWVDRSWVDAVENGLSGLGAFLFSENGFNGSRSNTGIQAEKSFSRQSFRGRKYLSDMVESISKKLISDIAKSV